ncbi:hypothetical protein KIL84_005533 [Mauremys mutica]|uniref:PIK helical domain-containing protein n=1 Tax=Mauremys mutica TaxID=74926 RepID=A0A9D3WP80_9SAUR|nr:hypothetical protein KIL84_005533 [Mauremys mutica]
MAGLTDTDRKRLWEKRYYCHEQPGSLPLLLTSAPSWEWACLPDIYALLKQWTYMNHQDALGLLHATFPDQEVRRTAIHWIDSMSDAELLDYLPQLVQALKYECYLDSPLVRFLMKRAICDLRITPLLLLAAEGWTQGLPVQHPLPVPAGGPALLLRQRPARGVRPAVLPGQHPGQAGPAGSGGCSVLATGHSPRRAGRRENSSSAPMAPAACRLAPACW